MALTVTIDPAMGTAPTGNSMLKLKQGIYDITFDTSYPAGGESLTCPGISSIKACMVSQTALSSAYKIEWIGESTATKLQVFKASGTSASCSEATAATDLSSLKCTVLAIGV